MTEHARLLRDIDASLKARGFGRRARRAIVVELEGHFEDAIEARREPGASAEAAERAAVSAFGSGDALVDELVANRVIRRLYLRKEAFGWSMTTFAVAFMALLLLLWHTGS